MAAASGSSPRMKSHDALWTRTGVVKVVDGQVGGAPRLLPVRDLVDPDPGAVGGAEGVTGVEVAGVGPPPPVRSRA